MAADGYRVIDFMSGRDDLTSDGVPDGGTLYTNSLGENFVYGYEGKADYNLREEEFTKKDASVAVEDSSFYMTEINGMDNKDNSGEES